MMLFAAVVEIRAFCDYRSLGRIFVIDRSAFDVRKTFYFSRYLLMCGRRFVFNPIAKAWMTARTRLRIREPKGTFSQFRMLEQRHVLKHRCNNCFERIPTFWD